MQEFELKAEKRKIIGKQVKQLRDQGLVPAILYGRWREPLPLQVERKKLLKVLAKAGTHHLINLWVDEVKEPKPALVREVQLDPITHEFLHVDFYAVVMREKITTEVPLVFLGQSPVVEKREGILFRSLDSVEVECLPSQLIESIEVNLGDLVELNQAVLVGDLKVGPDVKILTEEEEVVVQLLPQREEEVVEEIPAEVEVVTREKEAVEEEGEEEPSKEE